MKNKNFYKNCRGFTLVETMVSAAIFLIVAAGVYAILAAGRTTWFDTSASIELQQSLRFTLEKITRELNESGFDKNNVWQVAISDGAGVNSTDIIKFSIPIICHSGDKIIDSSGDIAYWGAPLTWGCTTSSCMDADNDCATRDYKQVQFALDNSNQLIRSILDNGGAVVRQDTIARNITDFQLTNNVAQTLITLQISAQKKSLANRTLVATVSMDVNLRN